MTPSPAPLALLRDDALDAPALRDRSLHAPVRDRSLDAPLRDTASAWLAAGRAAVLVEVSEARGSAPREAGTRMLVSEAGCAGTVGGGHLELKAIGVARAMLADMSASSPPQPQPQLKPQPPQRHSVHYPLGPSLGQCCGGAVTLTFEPLTGDHLAAWPTVPARFHLQLYGAGHVGRAIARLLCTLPVSVDWIDEREDEFPSQLGDGGGDEGRGGHNAWPSHIRKVSVDAVESEVRSAPPGAFYLVLTHQHDLDLRITQAILRRGDFGFLGLIGSQTKRQRFIHRLEAQGLSPELIARLHCPIGLPGIEGKAPEVIAVSVVAQLLQQP